MHYVVVDTNCLLQMISLHSPYRPAWNAFREGRYIICVSNEIISEYLEILGQQTTPFIAENIVNAILRSPFCQRFDPQYRFALIKKDPDDNKFVDCAIIANADYIVSDDRHFNVLKTIPFPHVHVVKLQEFVNSIE